MSHSLSLAQKHAWNLARTLMAPVVLFRSAEDEYGVLPLDEIEDGEVEVIFEYDPHIGGRSVH